MAKRFAGQGAWWALTAEAQRIIWPNRQILGVVMQEQAQLYQRRAEILKALAHPTRLWMVDQLARGEVCVCQFVEAVGVDFSTISKHLAVLKRAGLVEDERRGKQVFYRLRMPCVTGFFRCVDQVLDHSAAAGICAACATAKEDCHELA
jgi:ArsR family transcriptional regulator